LVNPALGFHMSDVVVFLGMLNRSKAGYSSRPARWRSAPLLVLLLLVAGVYRPLRNAVGEWGLCGIDFHQLHERRIAFAQEQQ